MSMCSTGRFAARCSRALGAATDSALNVGDIEAMLEFAGERASLAAVIDERVHVRALVDVALAWRAQGRNVEAVTRLRPLWVQVRERVLPQATLQVGAMLAGILLSAGELDEADAVASECAALGSRLVEFGPSRAFTLPLPHLVELSRGDWHRAIDGLRAAAATEADPHYRLHTHKERAAALARLNPRGAADEAHEAVSDALRDAEQARCERCMAEVTARGAEALARIGDVSGAGSSSIGAKSIRPMTTTASASIGRAPCTPPRAVMRQERSRHWKR